MTALAAPEPMLGRPALSEWLGVPEQTLAVWASQGKGPRYYRVGRHVRYRRSDVEAWLEQQSNTPAA